MDVSMQRLCAYLAAFAAVVGGIAGFVAIWTYVRLDIRAVQEDLSGRARQRVVAEHERHGAVLLGAQRMEASARRDEARGTGRRDDDSADGARRGLAAEDESATVCRPVKDDWNVADVDDVETACAGVGAQRDSNGADATGAGASFRISRELCIVHADALTEGGREV